MSEQPDETDAEAILDDPEAQDRRERRRLPVIGLWLTALYGVGLVVYLAVQGQNPADLRLNEPRYATLPNIMKAKKKKIEALEAA